MAVVVEGPGHEGAVGEDGAELLFKRRGGPTVPDSPPPTGDDVSGGGGEETHMRTKRACSNPLLARKMNRQPLGFGATMTIEYRPMADGKMVRWWASIPTLALTVLDYWGHCGGVGRGLGPVDVPHEHPLWAAPAAARVPGR